MTHCRSGECLSHFGCFCGCLDCREIQEDWTAEDLQNAEKDNQQWIVESAIQNAEVEHGQRLARPIEALGAQPAQKR